MATLHCPQRGGKFPNSSLVLVPASTAWAAFADVHLTAQPDLAAAQQTGDAIPAVEQRMLGRRPEPGGDRWVPTVVAAPAGDWSEAVFCLRLRGDGGEEVD